jgi:hypothetical protein
MRPINEADLMVMNAAQRVDSMHSALLHDVRDFAERMRKLVARLESEGTEARFNELGEIQDRGLQIDRALALLAAARANRDGVRSLVALARKDGAR